MKHNKIDFKIYDGDKKVDIKVLKTKLVQDIKTVKAIVKFCQRENIKEQVSKQSKKLNLLRATLEKVEAVYVVRKQRVKKPVLKVDIESGGFDFGTFAPEPILTDDIPF